MSTSLRPLTDRAAFERFKEDHPELGSALKIAAIPEAEFVQTYANGQEIDERQAYRIHQTAVQVQEQSALVWANLKDIASPYLQQTLFNNIPQTFLDQQAAIPGYDRLFGSLDFIECDESRSVLSPAAYFVDLMRFIEENITTSNTVPPECQLDQRRPDLFQLRLDENNTFDLIPYIDLVNEVLEKLVMSRASSGEDRVGDNAAVETRDYSTAEEIVAETVFPQSLPLNLPLAEIRAYLQQLNWDLPLVYETFATAEADKQRAAQRERLLLSPQELELLGHSLLTVSASSADEPEPLAAVYGFQTIAEALDTTTGLSQVDVFLERTGLTRQELNDLIYQDLDRFEVNAGLSRLFFINAVEDGLGPVTIEAGEGDPLNPTRPPAERLVNLSAAKLDRIYRFLKLARRLAWSFADLDWALRSLDVPYTPEQVLQFDGLNDFVQVPALTEEIKPLVGLAALSNTFTLEAWVNPSRHQANPILSRGQEDDTDIHFLLCLTATGRVAFYGAADESAGVSSLQTLTPGEFTHVAVTVQPAGDQSTVQIYINGELDRASALPAVTVPTGPLTVNIGRNLSDLTFAGLIKDVRIWAEVRSQVALADSRYCRLTGFEINLAAYWPLTESHGIELCDRTPYRQHGIPGGERFVTQPRWVSADLVLEPLPEPIGAKGYQFNGVDQFLAIRGVSGLEVNQFTLEAWIRVDAAGDNAIISKGNAGNRQTQFLLWVDEQNRLVFRSSSLGEFRSQSAVALETFTHVAVTVSATEIRLYRDGQVDLTVARPADTDDIDPRGTDLSIGSDFSDRYFTGVIQEVRLWNYARSAVELNGFIQRAVPSLAPGLIGYWPLNAISGELAEDLSVNANPLYLGGVPEDFRPDRVTVAPLLPELPVAVPGAVIRFDGDQDLLVLRQDSNFGLGRYPRFTLEFWFKPTVQGSNPEVPQLLFSQGDGEAGLAIYLEQTRLVAIAWCANYELTEVQETVLASAEAAVSSDQWHHVAIVHDEIQDPDAIEFRGFLNGVALEETSSTHENADLQPGQRGYRLSPVGSVYLGGMDAMGATRLQGMYIQAKDARLRGFAGQLTDLRLWNQARSAAAIDADRYRAPSLEAEGLMAYLPLDEGQDITVTDRVNGYTGQLRGQEAVFMAVPTVDPELQNRYSHYAPAGKAVLDWRNYVYTGELYVAAIPEGVTTGGLGVTFLSRHPEQIDQFYRLQVTWADSTPTFSLAAHPQGIQPLTVEQGSFPIPEPGTWYSFRIQVTDNTENARTEIAVTLWPQNDRRPRNPQVTAFDDSDVRITAGTVGLWVAGDQPPILTARFNNLRVMTLEAEGSEGSDLLIVNFKDYLPGENPTGWVDTGNRLSPRDATNLFRPLDLKGRTVLGTDSTLTGIHSHYHPADGSALTWNNYTYRGKLRFTEAASGIGLTFLSRTPEGLDQYYAIQRDADQPTFHLVGYPLGVQPLTAETDSSLDSSVLPQPETDYFVQVEVVSGEERTQIRAKVWEAGALEPETFQIQAFDDSDIRITAGTVGIWASGPGTKTFNDLTVLQETLLSEDFSAYRPGEDPANWRDTGANNSRREETDLFRTVERDGTIVFGSGSDRTNIHTHYQPIEALAWTNYTYSGRLLIAPEPRDNDIDGIGVTFFSRYTDPEALERNRHDQYYRLRTSGAPETFHIAPHPHEVRQVDRSGRDTGVVPRPNTWYRFLIEAHDTGRRTLIRAKIWPEGTPEPAEFQANTFDDNNSNNRDRNRLTAGTVGLWTARDGQKYFDDLTVRRGVYLSADLSLADWQASGSRNAFEVNDRLFTVERIPDQPMWVEVQDLPLLRRPLNLSTLQFNGEREYLALESLRGELTDSFTLEAWIQPGAVQINPVFSWGENRWFGLNSDGHVTLVAGETSLNGETALTTDDFTHVAIAIQNEMATLYINGVADGEGTVPGIALTAETVVEVGRFEEQYFEGQIRDLRLWNTAQTEFPLHQRYQTPDVASEGLLAYWSFAHFEQANTLDASDNLNHLRLGGLELVRKPTLFERTLTVDSDFWQRSRTILTFSNFGDGLFIPSGEGAVPPKRHTVELWVRVTDPQITRCRQVIYHSGDGQQGLVIYVHDGRLYFGGYNQPQGWAGTWLQTDRILANRWHHVALVLDSRAEVRPHAFRAYLDGKLVDLGDGVQLSTVPTTVLGDAAGDIRFHDGVATAADTNLDGAVLELRLWDTARTSAEIAAGRYVALVGNEPNLALWWRFKDLSTENPVIVDGSGHNRTASLDNLDRLQLLAPLTLSRLPVPVLNAETLLDLATFRRLMDRHNHTVERLTALWYDLRHTGRADNAVFFDRIFNPTGLMDNVWGYHDPARRWDVTGQELPSRDRAIRSRLMGTLQLSSEDLDLVVGLISGEETLVEVDTPYLRQLYRLSQIPRVLRLTVREYLVVLEMLGLTGIESLADLALICDRILEMRRIGITVDELNFLVNDVASDRIRPPYTETTIRVFADEVTNQSIEYLVAPLTFVSSDISELESTNLVAFFRSAESDLTIGALTTRYFVDDLGAVTDRYQSPEDLRELAMAQNWAAAFTELGSEIFAALQSAGFINEDGIILRSEDLDQFSEAFGNNLPSPTLLAEIQAVLENQNNRQTAIVDILVQYRDEHRNAILAGLSELLRVEPEPLQAVIRYFQSVGEPLSDPARLLARLMSLEENLPLPVDLLDYFYRLNKILFLVAQFELTTAEIQALLQHPTCFSVSNVFQPSLNDLVNLFTFTELKTAFGGDEDQLVQLLSLEVGSALVPEAILQISGWDRPQLLTLMVHFGTNRPYNRVENLILLQRGFTLAEVLRVDISFMLQLAATDDLSLPFYRQQANALLPALRGLYDDEQWPRVYRPLRDPLAVQKRDALLALALEDIPEDFAGRRSPDLLSEYLLLDVQVGSEVETSRIVQGTAALQQYVQRCLLNLEKGVNPATIPADQWNWMQNFRVWEANRKVFLYPESYIEPELRDTKTPLFEALEQELMQNDINVDTATQAFNNYLNKLAELADLKIVGSYLHRDVEELFTVQSNVQGIASQLNQGFLQGLLANFANAGVTLTNQVEVFGNSPLWRIVDVDGQVFTVRLSQTNRLVVSQAGNSTLYLVGRSTTEPRNYYYREWVNETQWLPWQPIDLAIDAEFVTPVFAFNRLFLFWVEFVETSRRNLDGETAAVVYQPTIRYSFPDFNGTWTTPQVYAQVARELTADEVALPQWQRVYALRSGFEVASLGGSSNTQQRERLLVIYGDTNNVETPLNVQTLRNARDQEQFQLQFRGRISISGSGPDMGLSPDALGLMSWYLGFMTSSNRSLLDDLANEDPEVNPEDLRSLLNNLFNAPVGEEEDGVLVPDVPFTVQSQSDNQWFITYNTGRTATLLADASQNQRLLARLENGRINVYNLSDTFLDSVLTLSSATERFLGYMTPENETDLNGIANRVLIARRDEFRLVLNNLFNRPRPAVLYIPDVNYEVERPDEEELRWLITFGNRTLEARLETVPGSDERRINVYITGNQRSSILRYRGFMTTANRNSLNAVASGDPNADRSGLRDVLNDLFDRPELSNSFFVTNNYTVERFQADENQWLITSNVGGRLMLAREEYRRINVYELDGDDPSFLAGQYAGFLTTGNQVTLSELANGRGEVATLASLRNLLNNLFDNQRDGTGRPPQLDVSLNYGVRIFSRSPASWLVTFGDSQLLLNQRNDRIEVINLFEGLPSTPVAFRLEDRGLNQWLVTHPNAAERFLLTPQGERFVNTYRFDNSVLFTAQIDNAGINDYVLASAPVELSTGQNRAQTFFERMPLTATLLDINNQNGWYVLDTGEEQFLVRADVAVLATDAERLVFPPGGEINQFSFLADPLFQGNPRFRFERLDTTAARELSVILFRDGLDGLLSLAAQQTQEGDFSIYLPTNSSQLVLPTQNIIDFDGAYGIYYREIFFHIPFLIANQLNANQNFADAQRWYHYIFNPTSSEDGGEGGTNADRYWQYLPFRNLDLESLAAILSNEEALAEYREDPFDPHAIARLRINAYQKAIVMKYIDNLLDWGDNLFAQENRESINQAFLLYVLAFNLLGPRPEARASRRFEEIGNYQGIREAFDETPEFLTELDLNGNVAARTHTITLNQNGNIITTFCVPENADFIGFWDRVESRLFNIRHSLNIEGIFRQLPLFQPPLDVRALVRAFANGNRDIGSLLVDLNRPVPHYRYSFMLERAKEMIGNVKDFGAALLDALEKRDAEQLAVLQTTHERNILELMTTVRELEIDEARGTLESLRISRENLQNRFDHFNDLIEGGIGFASLNNEEVADLTLIGLAQIIKSATVIPAQSFAAFAKSQPTITTGFEGPFGTFETSVGGDEAGAIADGFANAGQIVAEILQTSASLTSKIGEYKRRRNDWVLERRTAELDLQAADQQIAITALQIQRAEQELRIHRQQIEQNREVATFYRRKFTNEALYNWMISRLSGLYFQAYKLAYDFAKGAERALQYELPTNEQFINFGHWDSRRRGLLAGESLMLDVNRMEKFHLDNDSRFQEIEKTIPLSRVDPAALVQLLANGECNFSLTEALFNRDYPGHYFRVIKTIALSLQFADGSPLADDPYFTVNATLTQVGSKTLLDPDINAVRYLMGIEGATQPSGTALRVNWRANQQIAVSTPRQDNGMFGSFDLNFVFDDRYFPFEGTGAVSNWHLEIPLETNPELVERVQNADVLSLEDVIIHIKYTSKFDRGEFKTQVQEEIRRIQ